jgi:HEPN domain-containing protein
MDEKEVWREWMAKADEDFGFADSNLADAEDGYYAPICFHFHQAAEKCLKAYIVRYDLSFERVHDLVALLRICRGTDPSMSDLGNPCELLNPYYIETRYPVHWPANFDKAKAQEAKGAAETIRQYIRRALGVQKP